MAAFTAMTVMEVVELQRECRPTALQAGLSWMAAFAAVTVMEVVGLQRECRPTVFQTCLSWMAAFTAMTVMEAALTYPFIAQGRAVDCPPLTREGQGAEEE